MEIKAVNANQVRVTETVPATPASTKVKTVNRVFLEDQNKTLQMQIDMLQAKLDENNSYLTPMNEMKTNTLKVK